MKTACLSVAAVATVSAQFVGAPRPVYGGRFSPYAAARPVATPYTVIGAPVRNFAAAPIRTVAAPAVIEVVEEVVEQPTENEIKAEIKRLKYLNSQTNYAEDSSDDYDFNNEMIALYEMELAGNAAQEATQAFQENPTRITSLALEAARNELNSYTLEAFDWENAGDDEEFSQRGGLNTAAISALTQITRDELKEAEKDLVAGRGTADAYYKAVDNYYAGQNDLWYQIFSLQGKSGATARMDRAAAIDGYNEAYNSYLDAPRTLENNEKFGLTEMEYTAAFLGDVIGTRRAKQMDKYLEYQVALRKAGN